MFNFERAPLEYSGIFFDSANLAELKKWYETGILGGATTNPVILKKDNVLDIPGHVRQMIDIVGPGFPISIEVPDSRMPVGEMIDLARKYRDKFPHNAVIKVPMDPREPEKAFEVMHKLSADGIRLNATVGISAGQLIGASEAMRVSKADGDNYISLFWGRREEAREIIARELMEKENIKKEDALKRVPDAAATLAMTLNYLKTHSLAPRVIVGSIRDVGQIEKAITTGADIVTIPPRLIRDWMYTQRGSETVDQFNSDYESVRDKIKLI